ncbi:MAG TPA: PEP-CTERM sorting domain-containing protein [Vicinamibacterales bacterium]|nr:PEP-CTERM sorting domain-containing protein [Vicinamibacterales bacterium]
MKRTLVALGLVAGLATSASADPITVGVHSASGPATVSGLSTTGELLAFNLLISPSNAALLLFSGLQAEQNYQVEVTLPQAFEWRAVQLEIFNPASGEDNEMDPTPQPAYVPAGWSTSTDYDGFSFAQRAALERSFIVGGTTSFGVLADELTDMRDRLSFAGAGVGPAVLRFGLRDFAGGREFLVRLAADVGEAVPEPATLLLLGGGLLGASALARRRRRAAA